MATYVMRKQQIVDPTTLTISTQDIIAYERGSSLLLTEPVKQAVEIEYDALGYPVAAATNGIVNLGVQYDHRVTWLSFNLDRLIWRLNEEKGYTDTTKYNYYVFKIAFTDARKNTQVWEFDGHVFEIPRAITKDTGNYSVVVMIEEEKQDDEVGNIKDETHTERFITAPFKAKVEKSFYSPDKEIAATIEETDQKASLVKTPILGTLTDDGSLFVDREEVGQQYDNYISYIKFNPRNITAHLNDFFMFAVFSQGDKFAYSLFEQTSADDPQDDYSASHPVIAWIPPKVCESAGIWKMSVIAFAGNIDDMNNNEDIYGDYYFYVAKEARVKIAKNELTLEDVNKEPITTVSSNILTLENEIIIDKENKIFQSNDK